MLRFALILILVFAIPFVVYFAWRLIKGGPEEKAPTPLLLGAGFACSVIALLVLGITEIGRDDGDGAYAPPSLQDGQIRPGRFEEREREPSNDPAR